MGCPPVWCFGLHLVPLVFLVPSVLAAYFLLAAPDAFPLVPIHTLKIWFTNAILLSFLNYLVYHSSFVPDTEASLEVSHRHGLADGLLGRL